MLRELIDYIIIKRSGCFDPAYYLLKYPDCRTADVDPLWHFVRYGWREGRNPSAEFDTEYYLKTNPDVALAGANPLVHYLRYGRREGRLPKPSQAQEEASLASRSMRSGGKMGGLKVLIYTVGVKVYWAIPSKYRQTVLHWVYTHLGFIFRGMPDYEGWLVSRKYSQGMYYQSGLVDINSVEPARRVAGKIAVHLHVFYPDLVGEMIEGLRDMPFPYDLYISVVTDEAMKICRRAFTNLPCCREMKIRRVANRGRDVAPMFCAFGRELSRYDYVAHLHTKKSLYNRGATEGWREYLYRNLLGSEERIRRIFALMQGASPCGIVYPQNYVLLPYWANTWLANRELGRIWCARLGIDNVPCGYFDYPASSMFWARGDALAPLFNAGITLKDFPKETRQTDGTLAHTLERLFVLCSLKQGMRPGIIRDEENPSWSAWRFDQYTNRSYRSMLGMLRSPQVRLIAFDVFDTLLSRPLLNPETIKEIVARRAGGEEGLLYRQYRAIAEQHARHASGWDVGLDEIYAHLGRLTGLPEARLTELRRIEEEVEEASLEPRREVVRLYKDALATGRPVVLLTDMFLPRERIEKCLYKHGIDGWDGLYVSNEVGLRKDSGRLYEEVLTRYTLKPPQMLVIGDDARSDAQIPCDMGASFLHLLRPVELARGLPRFSALIASHERSGDVDAELTLGLVVRKNFAPILYPSFDPASLVQVTPYNLGYSLVGPLLVSFSNWLLQKAREDGVERLYLLSREGRLMKEVYDRWVQGVAGAPQSDYLVVSRRAAGVAAILTFEDVLEIAKTIYFPNTAESFLYTRYGLTLSDERWRRISEATGWDRDTTVRVWNRKIDPLVPLLRALEADIVAKAQEERQALLVYLTEKGLAHDSRQAVVDIGFGGSVQGYLNRLLPQKVHGYYLMTDDRSPKTARAYEVILRGCFCENVTQSPNAPAMYRYSFELEKLLSTTEPQVEYYEIDAGGNVKAHCRKLSPAEMAPADIREEIRRGAVDYVEDARRIREELLPDFQPSCWTAQMLMEAFLTQKSPQEEELLSKIVLDDHYCGRGLVP